MYDYDDQGRAWVHMWNLFVEFWAKYGLQIGIVAAVVIFFVGMGWIIYNERNSIIRFKRYVDKLILKTDGGAVWISGTTRIPILITECRSFKKKGVLTVAIKFTANLINYRFEITQIAKDEECSVALFVSDTEISGPTITNVSDLLLTKTFRWMTKWRLPFNSNGWEILKMPFGLTTEGHFFGYKNAALSRAWV